MKSTALALVTCFVAGSLLAQSEQPSYRNPYMSDEPPISVPGGETAAPGEPGIANAAGAESAGAAAVLRLELNEDVPAVVPVSPVRTTSIVFPMPIASVDGVGFTTDPKEVRGDFLIGRPAPNRLVIAPLKEGIRRNLSIALKDGRLFPLDIVPANPPGAAAFVVHFRIAGPKGLAGIPAAEPPMQPGGAAAGTQTRELKANVQRSLSLPSPTGKPASPVRLKGAVDAAKMLTGVSDEAVVREVLATMETVTFRRGNGTEKADLGPIELRLISAMRQDSTDTVIFGFTATCKAAVGVALKKESWTVRVKDSANGPLYSAALVDAPEALTPGQVAPVFLAITGTSAGGRNGISVENAFFPAVQWADLAPAARATAKPKPRK